jgi:rare lipoprotein A
MNSRRRRLPAVFCAVLCLGISLGCAAARASAHQEAVAADSMTSESGTPKGPGARLAKVPVARTPLDRSGRKRVGKASFYAKRFAGKKMADGHAMNPQEDGAASKTLPLGTTAKVTNLATGQSAVVTITDRGPYVPGRIVDLTPSTAAKIGIPANAGVAKVEVTPIAVPLQDGGIKAGAADETVATPSTHSH